MNEMIAYCGLNCVGCPIYLATREADAKKQKQMREQIARDIKRHYGIESRVEDVTDCDGCPTRGGRLFPGCQKCQIRKCAMVKGVENCAHCDRYSCAELDKHFATEPDAKKRLDEIKAGF